MRTYTNGRYVCQSTELAGATEHLSRWDLRHVVRDICLGEISLRRLGRILWVLFHCAVRTLLKGRRVGQLRGSQTKAGRGNLDLQAGEWVEVKSRAEVEATLNAQGRKRGLSFETEMLAHCGRQHQVAYPIRKIILEGTGIMLQLSNTVVLEGVICQANVKNCPRSNLFYWRETWLRRVGALHEAEQ